MYRPLATTTLPESGRLRSSPIIVRIGLLISCVLLAIVGLAQSPGIKVGIANEDAAAGRNVNLWAVVIGISRFQYGDQKLGDAQISNLNYAADDATEIYNFLRSPEGGQFPASNISLLVDEQATKANVEAVLEKLKQAKPEDYFVLFIATHGVIEPVRSSAGIKEEFPYFILYDTDPRAIAKSGLPMEDFKRAVNSIQAKKGLVLSDTCHTAGVMLDSNARSLGDAARAQQQWLAVLQEIPRGIGYLSASDHNEVSLEKSALGHGVFTYCLLEGVRGNADVNGDGKVTFEELRTYVRDEVPKMTNNRQHPQSALTMLGADRLPLSIVSYTKSGGCNSGAPCGTLRLTNPEVAGVMVTFDDEVIGVLESNTQRTIRVPIGTHKLALTKGALRQTQSIEITPNQTTSYEINAAFTQSDHASLLATTTQQKTLALPEERQPTEAAKKKLQEGMTLFHKQQFKDAIAVFNEAIRLNNGGYAQALTYRGRAEQSLGLKEAAIKSFSDAVSIRPTDYQTRTLLIEAKFYAGYNTEELVNDLRVITNLYPQYEFVYVVLGDVLFARGDKIGAEKALRKAVGLNPKFPPARMILAQRLMSKDPAAKVIEMGKEVSALPFNEACEQAEVALQLFQEVVAKKHTWRDGPQEYDISHIIFGGGRYTEDQSLAEANYTLGKAYTRYAGWEDSTLSDAVRLSYVDKGRVYIQEALRLSQNLPEKRLQFWSLWVSSDNAFLKGDSPRAIKDGEAALKLAELSADKFEIYTILYQSFYTRQEYGKAAEWLRKGLAVYGNQLPVWERQRIEEMLREATDKFLAQNRLPEAQKTIELLKTQEYLEYSHAEEPTNVARTSNARSEEARSSLKLTLEEMQWRTRYAEIDQRLATIADERNQLISKNTLTAREEAQLERLEKDLTVAQRGFQQFLEQLLSESKGNGQTIEKVIQLRESQALMTDLQELGKDTVAIYTLLTKDKLRLILVTSGYQRGREYSIKDAELKEKVLAFRKALQNPNSDPLPLAQELYRILIGPIAQDLKTLQAKTLMWSLDGVLRYVPMAALHDGKQYLVENYRNVIFTPASLMRLKDARGQQWKALGLGLSKGNCDALALPAVETELQGIIRSSARQTTGSLTGTIKLNEAFTFDALRQANRGQYAVVHIASHFQFQPGSRKNSYLLLGDCDKLNLEQISVFPQLFNGVELLTLSACDTATGDAAADGMEVESFAVLSQRQGAKAIMATLWPVADKSTALLMQEFYRRKSRQPNLTKAEALQQAQRVLLLGTETTRAPQSAGASEVRGVRPNNSERKSSAAANPKLPRAHPYYWAPFILIGNWK